jgi:hypothetical protein
VLSFVVRDVEALVAYSIRQLGVALAASLLRLGCR